MEGAGTRGRMSKKTSCGNSSVKKWLNIHDVNQNFSNSALLTFGTRKFFSRKLSCALQDISQLLPTGWQ
jgi:hypothetical protein